MILALFFICQDQRTRWKTERYESQRRWAAPLHHVQLVESVSRRERIREITEGYERETDGGGRG